MIKIFLKSLLIILTISLNAYAGVTNASQSTSTITKIAQSLSHSSNSVVNQSSNSSTTSSIINSADLKSDIKADALKFGLSVDTAAADVLTGLSSTDSATVSAALASLESNTGERDDDYVPTLDQDTIVYDTGWRDLEKVTSYDGRTYTSSNNVFDASGTQQARGKVYVNFKKKDLWADIDIKITRAEGTASTVESNYITDVASFSSVPIVATTVRKFDINGNNNYDNFAGTAATMKKNANEMTNPYNAGNEATLIDDFNNKVTGGSANGDQDIFFSGAFTTATSSTAGLGTIAVEGGYVDDNANEATFAASIERLEMSGELTGKAFEE